MLAQDMVVKNITNHLNTCTIMYSFLCMYFLVSDCALLMILSGRSVKEFVEACKSATGASVKVSFLTRRPGDYAEVYSDPSKIHDELNWTARYTDLRESLSTAWKWQKAHPNGYGSA